MGTEEDFGTTGTLAVWEMRRYSHCLWLFGTRSLHKGNSDWRLVPWVDKWDVRDLEMSLVGTIPYGTLHTGYSVSQSGKQGNKSLSVSIAVDCLIDIVPDNTWFDLMIVCLFVSQHVVMFVYFCSTWCSGFAGWLTSLYLMFRRASRSRSNGNATWRSRRSPTPRRSWRYVRSPSNRPLSL